MAINKLFGNSTMNSDSSAFAHDAALVREFTGAELTQEQFALYSPSFTLREVLGSEQQIQSRYYHLGVSQQMSRVDIMNDILSRLAQSGIVFEVNDDRNPKLLETLKKAASDCLAEGSWPRVSAPYRSLPVLNNFVRDLRQRMNLSTMDVVI